MNKTEMIKHIAENAGLTQKQATSALQAFETAIIDSLSNGETVELKGFGTFSVKQRAERTGRNPKTGEPITVSAQKTPHFKAGKPFKDAVN